MEKPIKIFKRGNLRLEIYQHDCPENPRNWDNLGKMVCFHKRYSLGDEHNINPENFSIWNEMKRYLVNKLDAAVVLPLYLYDHSGITIRTYPFSCPWDSFQVGFIYATRRAIREYYGVNLITKKVKERVENCLIGEVETYDQYLRGDVYGYVLKSVSPLDDGCISEDEIDSCWGFYGDDWRNNGIFDYVEGKFEDWVEVE